MKGEGLIKIEEREKDENKKCDEIMNGIKLWWRIEMMEDEIGGRGKEILDKRNEKNDEDENEKRCIGEFKMKVKGKGNEDIGEEEKKDRKEDWRNKWWNGKELRERENGYVGGMEIKRRMVIEKRKDIENNEII